MMGLWSKPKLYSTSVETVTYTEDLQRASPVLNRPVLGSLGLHDYIFQTELLSNTSMRPIQQITLDMEHVFLANAWRIARKFREPRDISAFITDAVVLHVPGMHRNKFKAAVENAQHPNGTHMFRLRDTATCLVCTTEPLVTEKFEI